VFVILYVLTVKMKATFQLISYLNR